MPSPALLLPLLLAALALAGAGWPARAGVAAACALIITLSPRAKKLPARLLLAAALLVSIAGDWLLSRRGAGAGDTRFIQGIALYFAAHLAFIAFFLKNGKPCRPLLPALLAGYGLFFILKLNPAIHAAPLRAAVLLYTLASILSLAAAAGLRLPAPARLLFTAGIAGILFSDTLIALREFLHTPSPLVRALIMPAYYAAHLLITAGATIKNNSVNSV
ncbi:MAG: lysoplasmalogenase [Opitutaceae bacterium]|nr:lysoplasmalogenase [Opitutaceae bacterium]